MVGKVVGLKLVGHADGAGVGGRKGEWEEGREELNIVGWGVL